MAATIQKFRCAQIPELKIIGISGNPVKYFVHAQQVVSILIGKESRRAATLAMQNFLQSAAGSHIRHGGDLLTAHRNGTMNAMVYTHYFHNGSNPSHFLTMDGVYEFLHNLPGQIEGTRRNFQELFDSYRASSSATFKPDTREDTGGDDNEEIDSADLSVLSVQQQTFLNFCIQNQSAASAAERKYLEGQIQIEQERVAMEKAKSSLKLQVKDVELVKQNENFTLQLQVKEEKHEREKADMRLQMKEMEFQTELASPKSKWTEEKAKMQADLANQKIENVELEAGRRRLEQDQMTAKVARFGSTDQMPEKLSSFYKMQSSQWNNTAHGVNSFTDLPDDVDEIVQEHPGLLSPTLISLLASGIEGSPSMDAKFHVFAFCYKGKRIMKQALLNSKIIKEAFGVEVDGTHYVCIILFRARSRRLATIGSVPHACGILPKSVIPELIVSSDPAQLCHVSVFYVHTMTDDPVLAMLKKPCNNKWKWQNPADKYIPKHKSTNNEEADGGEAMHCP